MKKSNSEILNKVRNVVNEKKFKLNNIYLKSESKRRN